MASTTKEALNFIDACRHAFVHLYSALNSYQKSLNEVQQQVAKLKKVRNFQTGVFIDRDQWSLDANFHYARYVEQIESID